MKRFIKYRAWEYNVGMESTGYIFIGPTPGATARPRLLEAHEFPRAIEKSRV
jgi:hypothetical protein